MSNREHLFYFTQIGTKTPQKDDNIEFVIPPHITSHYQKGKEHRIISNPEKAGDPIFTIWFEVGEIDFRKDGCRDVKGKITRIMEGCI